MSLKQLESRRRKLKTKWSQTKSGKALILSQIKNSVFPLVACSFSGGRDSLASTLLTLDCLEELDLPHRCYIVFNNTGNEFPETVRYVRNMFNWFRENYPHLTIIPVETKPTIAFSQIVEEMFYVAVKMYNEGKWDKYRLTCCDEVKIKPLREFLKKHTVTFLVTGLRGDESRQRFLAFFFSSPVTKSMHMGLKFRRKISPLWDWSWEDVTKYLTTHPKKPPLNPLYAKGAQSIGCFLCPVPFLFARQEIKKWYPKRVYERGLNLIRKAIVKTGQSLLESFLWQEIKAES